MAKKDKRSELTKYIDEYSADFAEQANGLSDQDYEKTLKNLERLTAIEARREPHKEHRTLDPNTVFSSVIGLIGTMSGILLIIKHEELHVIASKAFSWIPKMRI